MLAAAPLLALPVIAYNLMTLAMIGGFRSAGANAWLTAPLFRLRAAPGGVWPVSAADLRLAASVVILFVELLKSTTSRRIAIINHALSMLLFVACLVELLLAPAFATSTFFLISLMVLLDVLAGFIVTVAAARRQVDFIDER
ncbi:MAG TPA: hypothetical protein VFC47_14490 [Caulobacteraceae bacterium]|nr:hypothetical protein [Caulobacteraceae bacterium]